MTKAWKPALAGGSILVSLVAIAFMGLGCTWSTAAAYGAQISNQMSTVTPPLRIAVNGNHLVDASGDTITLHGANVSGPEFCCIDNCGVFANPTDAAGVEAMAAWHINAVRIPLNEDCWLGINGVGGAAYRAAVVAYVNTLNSFGVYAILDLHWGAPGTTVANGGEPLPDGDHASAFWESVASTFLLNHGVLFDLFNEPYDVPSWSEWLNGGPVSSYQQNPLPGQSDTTVPAYQAVGMQQLVDTVRSTGATQPVLVEGPNWGTELGTDWLTNAPDDPDDQMVASIHLYNNASTSSYQSSIAPVAAQVPVIVGELGENDCGDTDIDSFLPWADENNVSYMAWAWFVGSCTGYPSLISDYNGTPTAYGAGYEAHLQGIFPAPTPPGSPTTQTGSGGTSLPVAPPQSSGPSNNSSAAPSSAPSSAQAESPTPEPGPGLGISQRGAASAHGSARSAMAEDLRTIAARIRKTVCASPRRTGSLKLPIVFRFPAGSAGIFILRAQSAGKRPRVILLRSVVNKRKPTIAKRLRPRALAAATQLCGRTRQTVIRASFASNNGTPVIFRNARMRPSAK